MGAPSRFSLPCAGLQFHIQAWRMSTKAKAVPSCAQDMDGKLWKLECDTDSAVEAQDWERAIPCPDGCWTLQNNPT